MKKFLLITLILSVSGFLYAQEEVGAVDPERLGIDTAQQSIKEVSVDKFEHDGFWRSSMSSDNGFTTTRLFRGAPAGKQPIPDEEGMNIPDDFVLGTRVDFLRRGYHSFFIYPIRPIPIEGIVKTISVWVAGRNFEHELYILIEDYFGRHYELFMGKLNFMGWQKLTVAIPPQSELQLMPGYDGFTGIAQRSVHFHSHFGLKVVGFRVDCHPLQARGSFYIYFDDLRATTDLFAESYRDADDMVDGW